MRVTLGKETLSALRWMAQREPVVWFDATAPSEAMRKSLEGRGLIEGVLPANNVGMIKYKLTLAGRVALESKP